MNLLGEKMAKKLSRREFMKMAAIGASGAVLASCGVQQTPAPAAPVSEQPAAQPAAPEKQVVTFTMYGHPGMVEEMVPLFNAANPDVEVRFERSEGQGYWEKLQLLLQAEPPGIRSEATNCAHSTGVPKTLSLI
jgi:ABC-type glycerol-3-phosphate transport system substrate-binding protein